MTTALNIFAVILLSVLPYVRPCPHGGFKLWCSCDKAESAKTDEIAQKQGDDTAPC
jgi:hypothetical protein